jgi:uncharacterized protein (DUF1778 family)
MAPASNVKNTTRLEARISPETKAIVQKAADLEGRTLTDFVIATVLTEARKVIAQHQTLTLSLEDSQAFVEALLNPPEPNQTLISAGLRYKEMVSD